MLGILFSWEKVGNSPQFWFLSGKLSVPSFVRDGYRPVMFAVTAGPVLLTHYCTDRVLRFHTQIPIYVRFPARSRSVSVHSCCSGLLFSTRLLIELPLLHVITDRVLHLPIHLHFHLRCASLGICNCGLNPILMQLPPLPVTANILPFLKGDALPLAIATVI